MAKRSLVTRVALALALAAGMDGCTYDTWGWEACELDRDICTGIDGWQTSAECALADPLQVQLGTGESHLFVDLPAATPPNILQPDEYSIWSMGDRVYLGARIANPTAGHKRFLLRFRVCSTGEFMPAYSFYGGDFETVEGLPECKGRTSGSTIQAGESMQEAADGSVARGGIAVPVGDTVLWAAVYVQDECGREGVDMHIY